MPFDSFNMPSMLEMLSRLRQNNRLSKFLPNNNDPYKYRTPPFIEEGHQQFDQSQQLPNQFRDDTNQLPSTQMDRYNELYKPSHELSDAYNTHMSQFPSEGKHSKWKQLGAALVAAASSYGGDRSNVNAERFLHGGEERKLSDWRNKATFLERGADNERGENTNRRMIARDIMNNENQDNRLKETERYNRERDQNTDNTNARLIKKDEDTKEAARKRNEINEKRATTYAEVAKGGQLLMDKTGRTYIVYKNGTKRDVDVDQFSAAEMEDLRQKNRVSLENTKSGNTIKEIDARTEGQKEVVTHKSSITGIKLNGTKPNESSTQQKQRYTNAARVLISRHPEWEDYIQFDKNNNYDKIIPTGKSGRMKQLTPAEIQNLGNIIFERQPLPKEADKKSDPLGIRK